MTDEQAMEHAATTLHEESEEREGLELQTKLADFLARYRVAGSLAMLVHVCDRFGYAVRQRGEYTNVYKVSLLVEPRAVALSLDELRSVLDDTRPVGMAVTVDLWLS